MPEGPRGCVRLGTSYGGYWKLRGAGAGPQGESAEPTRSLPRPSARSARPWGAPLGDPKLGGVEHRCWGEQGYSGTSGGVATPHLPQRPPPHGAVLLQGPGLGLYLDLCLLGAPAGQLGSGWWAASALDT